MGYIVRVMSVMPTYQSGICGDGNGCGSELLGVTSNK